MSYLIDTCVVSELTAQEPDPGVLRWFKECPDDEIFISSLTLGELSYGIALLDEGRKKSDLLVWYNNLADAYKDAIIPVSDSIAVRWGLIRARLRKEGIQLPVIDGLIACSALEFNHILVTRNTRDYESIAVRLFNPWQ